MNQFHAIIIHRTQTLYWVQVVVEGDEISPNINLIAHKNLRLWFEEAERKLNAKLGEERNKRPTTFKQEQL